MCFKWRKARGVCDTQARPTNQAPLCDGMCPTDEPPSVEPPPPCYKWECKARGECDGQGRCQPL